ncbi:hypothetical protein [Thalassospira povalilytica]|uniref:hypothetical protein n=1 Tax=Thalassospira povalilytica TaxID=732237 RepID=UPI001D19602A|nr:hypothetical protein [Thalassospira povalilytica]MCC4242753.1 hypothetical protein [Thalassospira povalilytica]
MKKLLIIGFFVALGAISSGLIIAYLNKEFGYGIDHTLTLIASVVGGFSLAFGGYFALLAVDAYTHAKFLRDANEKAQETEAIVSKLKDNVAALNESITHASSTTYQHGHEVFNALGLFVTSISVGTDETQKRHLTQAKTSIELIRARFALSDPHLRDEELQPHILLVHARLDSAATEALQKIAESPSKSVNIKAMANAALTAIKEAKAHAM